MGEVDAVLDGEHPQGALGVVVAVHWLAARSEGIRRIGRDGVYHMASSSPTEVQSACPGPFPSAAVVGRPGSQ